jgi:hypothetical protein
VIGRFQPGFVGGDAWLTRPKERTAMSVVSPWHSIKSGVHHNNTECNTGNNIERENYRTGTGGKPLCAECENLRRPRGILSGYYR